MLRRLAVGAGFDDDDSRRLWRILDLIGRESLEFTPSPGERRFSGICRDGSPWQYCAVLGREGPPIRFLTEVGPPDAPLGARIRLTVQRLAEVLDLAGASGRMGRADILAGLAPPYDDARAGVWLGVAVGSQGRLGLRVYANCGWDDELSRWMRLIEAWRGLGAEGFAGALTPHIPLLTTGFSISGFAMTVTGTTPTCKLYLRPADGGWDSVKDLVREVLPDGAGAFLAKVSQGLGRPLEGVRLKSAVISLAGRADGGPLDFKLDLCGHCLPMVAISPAAAVDGLAGAFGLDPAPWHALQEAAGGEALSDPDRVIAFVGIGMDAYRQARLNVYMSPFAAQ